MSNVPKRSKRTKRGAKRPNKVSGSYVDRASSYFTVAHRPSFGFAPRQEVSLCYCDVFVFNATAVTGYNQQYRMNSLFDPDLTGTGHQPYRFDQLATFFTRYRVFRCSWRVTAVASVPVWLCVVPTNGDLNAAVTNVTTFQSAAELPYAQLKSVPFSGGPPTVISGTMALNELGGVTPTEYNSDDRYQAQVSTNPSELIYLNVAFVNNSASNSAVYYTVELAFDAQMYDPAIVAAS
jgi:hypothetical protein